MKILVVGQGRLVYFLCQAFLSKNDAVTIIDPDREECTWLARRLKAVVVHGDGSDPRLLEEAGAEGVNAVVAITPRDEDNLAVCQLAQHYFGVPRTLALVNDPAQEQIFKDLGVGSAFSITQIISSLIEQRVDSGDIINLIPVGEGKVNLTEVILNRASPAAGKALADIGLPEGSLVACVFRGEGTMIPRGGTVLLAGDRLVLMTLPENHGRVVQMLTEESG